MFGSVGSKKNLLGETGADMCWEQPWQRNYKILLLTECNIHALIFIMLIIFSGLSCLLCSLVGEISPNKPLIIFTATFLNLYIGRIPLLHYFFIFCVQAQALGIHLISLTLYLCFSKSERARWLI